MTTDKDNVWRFARLGAWTVASLGGMVAGFRSFGWTERVPAVDATQEEPPGGGEWPLISVIVPARNEERNLPRLLPSLLGQKYPNYEVIVVDDQSTDATPNILAEWAERDARLRVVQGSELPKSEDWRGKPYAMHQGVQQAGGEWLLFTDADTVHSPFSISSSMSYALAHDVDLFTIYPTYDLVNPSERLVMPVAFQGIAYLYPADKVNDPRSTVAIANGQYLFIKRATYDAVGGIERVKSEIVEDLEFARLIKREGYRLLIGDGRHLMRVRMYTNLAEIWEGWSKNVVLSFRGNPGQGAFATFGVFSLTAMPFIMLRWAVRSRQKAKESGKGSDKLAAQWVTTLAVLNTVVPILYRRRVDKTLGLPPGWALTNPIGTAIIGGIMLYSLVRLATGKGVVWKGRTYTE